MKTKNLQGSYKIAEMEFQAISRFFPGFMRPLGYGLGLHKQAIVYNWVRQPLLLTFSSNSNNSTCKGWYIEYVAGASQCLQLPS